MIPKVLILSNEQDVSADWVVRELRRRRVPFHRLNTERLARVSVAVDPINNGWVIEDSLGKRTDLSIVKSVWFRRPDPPGTLDHLSTSENALLRNQWRALIDALCDPFARRLVNDPKANRQAELKMLQLKLAHELGFLVPKTLVTNDRDKAAAFLRDECRTGVVKGLDSPYIEDQARFLYTQRVDYRALTEMAHLDPAPLIFQEEIAQKRDVRVTVIGKQVFGAIASRTEAVDWRAANPRPDFAVHQIDEELAGLCKQMTAQLGLTFAAIDLALTPRGVYHFLEVNPNGEWGWLQSTLGLPIAETIVDELCIFGES